MTKVGTCDIFIFFTQNLNSSKTHTKPLFSFFSEKPEIRMGGTEVAQRHYALREHKRKNLSRASQLPLIHVSSPYFISKSGTGVAQNST